MMVLDIILIIILIFNSIITVISLFENLKYKEEKIIEKVKKNPYDKYRNSDGLLTRKKE